MWLYSYTYYKRNTYPVPVTCTYIYKEMYQLLMDRWTDLPDPTPIFSIRSAYLWLSLRQNQLDMKADIIL